MHTESNTPKVGTSQRLLLATALTLAVVTLAAACSKADEPSTQPGATSAPVATSVTAGTSTPGSVPGSTPKTERPGSTATSKPGTSTTSKSTGTTSKTGSGTTIVVKAADRPFCDRNNQLSADLKKLDAAKDFSSYIAAIKKSTSELLVLAPDEIKADVKTVVDAVQNVTTAAEMETLSKDPSISSAGDKVSAWSKSHCNET